MTAVYYTPGHVSDRAAVTGDFAAAADWLGEFHRHSAAAPLSVEEWRAGEYADLMKVYRAKVGYNGREEPLFALMDDRMNALKDAKVPQTGLHGDFWMGNLMLEGSRRGRQATITGVIDWELGGPSGTPIHDVYKFPTSYGFYLDRTVPWAKGKVKGHLDREDVSGRWRSYSSWPNMLGFGHTYFGKGWFPELVRTFIRERESALGIDPALTPILFCCFLVDQAQRSTVPEFRDGYRAALAAFAEERDRTWLWSQ
jgi:aminoglycoside phosphotransferase (APT) family kinase protein